MKKFIFVVLASFIAITIQSQNYQVIVNNSNSVSSLSTSELSDYFLKKKNTWSDNSKVVPIDLSSKSAVRESFSKNVHKKSTSQVRAFWQQAVFAGKDTPPREMDDENAVVAYVKANKGAIGYISTGTSADGVKVLAIK